MSEEHIAVVRNYLAVHVEVRMRNSMRDPGWCYWGMEDFVLQEGEVFREVSPHQPVVFGKNRYRPRFPRHCFNNSYLAAVASRGNLRYVEGYAYSRFLPVHHAWNIDGEGRVVDTTWCAKEEDDLIERPKVGTAYYGVIFPTEYVRSTRTKDNTSVIDQWEKRWPLLCTPFTQIMEVAA